MASVEAGPSVLSGAQTTGITPAGGIATPVSSAHPYSMRPPDFSVNPDSGDYGLTILSGPGTIARNLAGTPLPKYRMIGMDQITNGLYDTWEVTGTPDYTGGSYVGGLNTPLRSISVLSLVVT